MYCESIGIEFKLSIYMLWAYGCSMIVEGKNFMVLFFRLRRFIEIVDNKLKVDLISLVRNNCSNELV